MKDCCCKDIHRDTCYAIRYPNYDFLHAEHPETCECPCHDQYAEDECDCYDCTYPDDYDKQEMKDDYELMSELARGEAEYAKYIDENEKSDGFKQEDGNWDD